MIRRGLLIACGAVAAANIAFQIAGCNQDSGYKAPPAVDAGEPPETGGPLCAGSLPVMYVIGPDGKPAAPDWTCYDDGIDAQVIAPLDDSGLDAPLDVALDVALDVIDDASDAGVPDAASVDGATDSGAVMDGGPSSTFKLADFISNQPVPGATIDIYFSNDPSKPADFTAVTGANGQFAFPSPPKPVMTYSVRDNPDAASSAQLVPLVWLDNISPKPGEVLIGNSITKSSEGLLAAGILGSGSIDSTKMTTVIGVRDCQYRDVTGGIVQLVDGVTGEVLTNSSASNPDFRGAYFNASGFPDPVCSHTVAIAGQAYALYAALNVPTDHPIIAKAFGRRSDVDPVDAPHPIGTRELPAFPGRVVIVRPYKVFKK